MYAVHELSHEPTALSRAEELVTFVAPVVRPAQPTNRTTAPTVSMSRHNRFMARPLRTIG